MTLQFPNWFKVVWWLALSTLVSIYLVARYPELAQGHAVPADIFVFLVWTALLLAPLYSEVEFFGLKFKQELEKAKNEIKAEIVSVRTELKNAVDVSPTISPQFMFPAPAPDSQLGDIEKRIRKAVDEAFAANGVTPPAPGPTGNVSEDVMFLFSTRYGLEKELRRLAESLNLELARARVGGIQLLRALAQKGAIDPNLQNAIREVYAVSSVAVHAEDITEAQVKFVRDVGPQLVGALQALRTASSRYQT